MSFLVDSFEILSNTKVIGLRFTSSNSWGHFHCVFRTFPSGAAQWGPVIGVTAP